MSRRYGKGFCGVCNKYYDYSQLAFWTDEKHKCPICFKSATPVDSPNYPLVVSNPDLSEGGKNIVVLILDGLYVAGVQRHCLYLLQTLKDLDVDTLLIAVEGGGAWAEGRAHYFAAWVVCASGKVISSFLLSSADLENLRSLKIDSIINRCIREL